MNSNDFHERNKSVSSINWGLTIWIIAFLSIIILTVSLISAWSVRNVILFPASKFTEKQSELILNFASFPSQVKLAFLKISDQSSSQVFSLNSINHSNFIHHLPEPKDDGFLLFSGYDPLQKKSLIQLIRVTDGKVMANWAPDLKTIDEGTSGKKWAAKRSIKSYQANTSLTSR